MLVIKCICCAPHFALPVLLLYSPKVKPNYHFLSCGPHFINCCFILICNSQSLELKTSSHCGVWFDVVVVNSLFNDPQVRSLRLYAKCQSGRIALRLYVDYTKTHRYVYKRGVYICVFFYRILTELVYLKCIYMQWGHRRMHFILINFQLIQFPSAKGTQSGQSKRILTYIYSLVTANGHSANYV